MRLDVFGTRVEVTRKDGSWVALYAGNDGKKRPARDIVIPDAVAECDVAEYVADLCHEWATPVHDKVMVIE